MKRMTIDVEQQPESVRSLMCSYKGKRLLCFVEEIKEMWEAS